MDRTLAALRISQEHLLMQILGLMTNLELMHNWRLSGCPTETSEASRLLRSIRRRTAVSSIMISNSLNSLRSIQFGLESDSKESGDSAASSAD
uniref:Uncharacterized protein n=1 Tax=Trichuris muris TaxID=70415 RepID=A0A5S6QVL6_TRIMR